MEDKAELGRFESVVRSLVHRWDPYNLLKGGAPKDEWDDAIRMIVARVHTVREPSDATRVVSRVFSCLLGPAEFTLEMCESCGQELFQGLKSEGLLHDQE